MAPAFQAAATQLELPIRRGKVNAGAEREREEWFEMFPPTIFAAGSSLFKSGSATRHAAADARTGPRFCRQRPAGRAHPALLYPELA